MAIITVTASLARCTCGWEYTEGITGAMNSRRAWLHMEYDHPEGTVRIIDLRSSRGQENPQSPFLLQEQDDQRAEAELCVKPVDW